jgi:hypothetical protein
MMGGSTNYAYTNPYAYVPPVTSSTTIIQQPAVVQQPAPVVQVFDYSQPIPAPAPPPAPAAAPTSTGSGPPPEPQPPPEADAAQQLFADARAAFAKQEYAQSLGLIDKAVKELPSDAVLHEFRALVLFAMKDYRQSAAAIYSVLAAGPGWGWDTMKALYPDVNVYTAQLRALEEFKKNNPKASEASLLLAYHYLVLDHKDEAVKQFEKVLELMPKDKLSAALLKMLKEEQAPAGDKPAPKPA